jgi:hypothetical protein
MIVKATRPTKAESGKPVIACAGGCKDKYPGSRELATQQIPGTLIIVFHLAACPQVDESKRFVPWGQPGATPLSDVEAFLEGGKFE